MKTVNHIIIRAPWRKVYSAAERIVDWPRILPHYRWVTIFEDRDGTRQVEMAASRDGFPCRWRSEQQLRLRKREVYYRHTKSFWTQGMEVWWKLVARKDGYTEITLTHDMPKSSFWPLEFFRRHVIGALFVMVIADRTLAGLKRHLEQS